jgi:hypothetical protein
MPLRGAFVAAVGADNPEKQEIDPRLMARARILVDDLEASAAGGDLAHALKAGTLRRVCKTCGGHVMTDHPQIGLIDVYAATIPDLAFEPQVHIHYGEKVLSIPDGLPKFKDVPAEFGGSGDKLPE